MKGYSIISHNNAKNKHKHSTGGLFFGFRLPSSWSLNMDFERKFCQADMHPNITPKLRDVIKHTFKFLYLFSVKMEVYLKSGFRFRKSRLCDIRTLII